MDNIFQPAPLDDVQPAQTDETVISAEDIQEMRDLDASEQPSSTDNLETGEDETPVGVVVPDAAPAEDAEDSMPEPELTAEAVVEAMAAKRAAEQAAEPEAATEDAAVSEEPPKKARRTRRPPQPGVINRDNVVETAMDKIASEALEKNTPSLEDKRREAIANADSTADAPTRTRSEVVREARERSARHAETIKTLAAWDLIRNAERHQRLVVGTVASVEEVGKTVCAILDVSGFRTIIPFSNFYLTDPIDYTTVNSGNNLRIRQMQVLSRVIGLETPLAIDSTAPGKDGPADSIILGNRKKALEQMNDAWFTGEHPHVHEGDIVDGIVTAVGTNAIRLLLGGVETKLQKFQCTHRYVPDMTKEYSLNQPLKVRITEIKVNENGTPVLRLDALVAEREVMADNLRKIRLGGRYAGYLTRTTQRPGPEKALRYHLHIMPQDVYAIALGSPEQFSYRMPEHGDTLLFVPGMIDENRGMTIGRIIGFVNRSAENSGRNGISRSIGDMLNPRIYKE